MSFPANGRISEPAYRLEDRSRRTLSGFAAQFGCGTALVLGLCLLGLRPWDGAIGLLALVYSLSGAVAMIRAARRGDHPLQASLSLWDVAMASNACSLLLHGIMEYQG
jgi:hypothetical protein